ncbi:MAG: ABC transporter ATP-binding protein [Gammaproteobacteria bacterium]|nr:ABC transporter ATP-binding protein [Gammaproteobacteria bacterium]MXY55209.1 ABC transporter ATP-binding protein [Gammaproteobacteria bacterium]MYF30659.1 ABC transporter ATP-binding protein [Gammaproteobacteria bacterium]MYK46805.1 ABC transporter ATP-binding protein [Gammaproteobacteria bacterium]
MALEFDQVSHRYGDDPVLRDVALAARPGEITCLLGPSGSGKSTLLRLAAGLERLQSGAILLDGETLAEPGREPPPERRPIGLVFQDHVLFPHMTVRANVEFGLRAMGSSERRRTAEACMASVGLAALADRYPDTLSGGQQQRVALARALAPRPRAILLDEPFANVDATLRRALREDARRALRSTGCITLLVTHDPEEALELADHIGILEDGRIVQAGNPDQIWHRPAHKTVAVLFGQAQHVRGTLCDGVIATAFGELSWQANQHDGPVDVVVRPNDVALRPASQGPRVADIRFLGDRYTVFVERDGETLRASMADRPAFDVGDFVTARFNQNDTFVYNRK